MEIKFTTKFNLGDTVYFVSSTTDRIIEATVVEIVFYIEKTGIRIYYKTEPYDMVLESVCFASKDEIINKLKQ